MLPALRNENADLRKQLGEVCSQRCRLQQKSDEECEEIRSLQSVLDGVSMELKEKEDSVEEFKNQVRAARGRAGFHRPPRRPARYRRVFK